MWDLDANSPVLTLPALGPAKQRSARHPRSIRCHATARPTTKRQLLAIAQSTILQVCRPLCGHVAGEAQSLQRRKRASFAEDAVVSSE